MLATNFNRHIHFTQISPFGARPNSPDLRIYSIFFVHILDFPHLFRVEQKTQKKNHKELGNKLVFSIMRDTKNRN